ncbi:MAG: adenylate/guanylate cyclase domain-containing protein [Butyrivibrio sp.]|uniref:CHASE2 domain-containing protein n=1 Tax=Butyrivibrio sp. TaxID=28121 RepID=UPI0025C6BE5F|nr:adenylate/guanylate cyclase domain-containing protein [Butyrivibrio sp.]MBQ6589877.1 adenylate/guanylate cyclase domain-containing protein [Butyrivibrio sp.]
MRKKIIRSYLKRPKYRNLAILFFILTVLYTFAVYFKVVNRADKWIQDSLYQKPQAVSGEVVIIGIDNETIEHFGPYNTWDRNIMASALEALGSDPDNKPAVVAIDTLYIGDTDKAADSRLANAAEKLGNVIVASAGVFGSGFIEDENGKFQMHGHLVYGYDEPYEGLKNVTRQGHINAMYDMDGVLRHSLLYFDYQDSKGDTRRIYSMAHEAASMYGELNGITINDPEVDERGHFYLSYTATPGTYNDGMNLYKLINGDVPADYYAGKIVLIGPYAAGLQDEYFAPIDRAQKMYGVEYQANVIEALLRGDYKKEMSDVLQAGLLFIAILVGVTVFVMVPVKAATVIMIFMMVVSFGVSYILYVRGWLVHVIWMPLGILIMYVASLGVHYLRAALEKRRVTKTFERYVAPEIVKEIMKEGMENLSLGGKTCDIAVLFVDVRGFTTMSERLSPEKVVFILNKYLTMASDCVEKNKGTLDKFVGDAMMAFWGAPLPQDDAIYNAVRTAMDIIDGAKRVSDELKEEIGEELRVGVGVNFGPAVVGNMGAVKHMDYTAIGDTVNTAARLEANAPGGTVYISRVVADALEGRIKVTSLGDTIKLKGKAEGFEVLKVDELM